MLKGSLIKAWKPPFYLPPLTYEENVDELFVYEFNFTVTSGEILLVLSWIQIQ